jgi:hypothetical protein
MKPEDRPPYYRVLPHYEKSRCHGPCDQGRLPCPTPDACELHLQDEETWAALGRVAAVLVAAVVLAVLLLAATL